MVKNTLFSSYKMKNLNFVNREDVKMAYQHLASSGNTTTKVLYKFLKHGLTIQAV